MAKDNVGANNPIEAVEFRATAPKQALPGLDDALVKLRALKTELDLVNGLLSGTSTHSAFKQTAKEMEQILKTNPLTKNAKKLSPSQVAQALGVPDEKDFNTFLNRFKATQKELAKTMFSGGDFRSAGQASQFARKYFLAAERETAEHVARLQALFNQGIIPKPGAMPKMPASPVPAGGSPAGTGGSPVPPRTPPVAPGGGGKGKTKEEEQAAAMGKAFRERLAAIERDMQEEITSLNAGKISPRPDVIGQVRGHAAASIRLAVGEFTQGDKGLEEESVVVQNALAKAARLEADQEKGRQARMAQDLKATGEARAALAKAEAAGDKEKADRAKAEIRNLEQEQAARRRMDQQRYQARARMAAAGAKSQAQAEQQAAKVAALTQQELFARVTGMGALQAEAFLQQRGAALHSYKYDQMTGRYIGARYTYDEGGYRHNFDINYGASAGSAVTSTSKLLASPEMHKTRLDRAKENLSLEGLAANILSVGEWAAAVGVLYKTFDLAKYSLERLVMTGVESAHLGVVFRGVGGDAQALTNDIIRLAAQQGRETSEAMESATAWARLGGGRKTINEEVRVSAMAANIANMHTAETTKQLMSLMHIYHLEAGDLNGTLGMLVNTSLKYNVTLEELFTGLDRSAAAAKVAGMGLAELQAMIGVVVGATGATGSTTGNAIKYVFQELNKSGVQRQLRGRGIEALGDNLEQKPAGQILADLAGKWGSWGQRERQAVSGQLGGRFNAARVPVIIEDYPKILRLAIDGQLNLNRAQDANVQILETLKAQLAGVRAEWDRLVMNSNAGPFAANLARTGKNVLHWANENLARQETGTEQQEAAARNRELARQMREPNFFRRQGNFALDWFKTVGYWTGGETWGTPYSRHLYREQPGIVDLFNYTQEPGDFGREQFLANIAKQTGNADISAKRARALGIGLAQLKNGSMTPDNANDYALIMQKMSGGLGANGLAAQFARAFGSHDTLGATATLTAAQQQALMEESAQKRATKEAADARLAELTGQADKLQAESNAAQKAGQIFNPAKQKQLDDLHQAMELATADANDATGAYEEMEGQIDNVAISLEKYTSLLKSVEQEHKGLEKLRNLVPAFSEGEDLQAQQGMLMAQIAATQAAYSSLRDQPDDKTSDRSNTLTALLTQMEGLQSQLNAVSNPAAQALAMQFDIQKRGVRAAGYFGTANDYGADIVDKLLRQREALTSDMGRLRQTGGGSQEATGQYLEERRMLFENELKLTERRAEVEREINQLYYDRSREFRKNTLGGGPEQLLRTLAAFRTAFNDQGGLRNISPGQLLAMGPEFRASVTGAQAFGISQGRQLPPGAMFLDPQMMELMRERNRTSPSGTPPPPPQAPPQSAPKMEWSRAKHRWYLVLDPSGRPEMTSTATAGGSRSAAMDMPSAPDWSGTNRPTAPASGNQDVNGLLEISCRLLTEFNTNLTGAAQAADLAREALGEFAKSLADTLPAKSALNGPVAAPSVPQGGGLGGARGYPGVRTY